MKGRHAMVVRWYLVRRMLAFFWICIFVIGFTVYILDKYNSSVTGDAMRLSFEDRIFRLQEDLQRIQALLNNSKRECHSKNSVPKLPADNSEV
ncbi:unnamed protein product [Thelazia callipaeda]|uniref:Uncharacterized protein n=1 Tax=Thelazia callipaeda TaxID=103827 RepID=A0A0N5CKY2_THECL|nr:unnamed protein product [Thelazia callipaeda]